MSWRILLDDLGFAYKEATEGRVVSLPAKTSSFKAWAEHLNRLAQSTDLGVESEWWLTRPWQEVAPLPLDRCEGENVSGSGRQVVSILGVEETRAILKVPSRTGARIDELLVAALAHSLVRWTQSKAALIDLEAHGRDREAAALDLTRTVGWFTSLVPALLQVPAVSNLTETLGSVKEQLRAIPHEGLGHGLLRYLRDDDRLRERLGGLPRPEVSFLYLGRSEQILPESGWLGPAPESPGASIDARSPRSHVLEVSGMVAGGQLRIVWTYSENLHERVTIEGLAAGFVEVLRELTKPDGRDRDHAPSDFPAARLNQKSLATLLTTIRRSGER